MNTLVARRMDSHLPASTCLRHWSGGGDPESRLGFKYMAGYEGRRGRACIAYSHNGVQFSNLDNDQDRREDGLNDDCLTENAANGANSILARARHMHCTNRGHGTEQGIHHVPKGFRV